VRGIARRSAEAGEADRKMESQDFLPRASALPSASGRECGGAPLPVGREGDGRGVGGEATAGRPLSGEPFRSKMAEACRLGDAAEDLRRVLEDLSIGETKHGEATSTEVGVSVLVVLDLVRLRVHRAVEFDDEPVFVTTEVHDVDGDRELPSELQSGKLAPPK
jgi:hypothetical protein